MVRMIPYGLVLKLSWGNERPASFNFTIGKRFRKVCQGNIWQIERLADYLLAFTTI
jgi:hypothetical protein